jgi:hypothetical protein
VSTATCDFRFSLQDEYADAKLVGKLAKRGISNRALTISGHVTMSHKDISRPAFIAAVDDKIRTRMRSYLERHAPRAGDLVILDMEPDGIAPRQLGKFVNDTDWPELIAAYRQRIRIARQELEETGTPDLKLGLYQVIVPDEQGRQSAAFKRRLCGYVKAGELGM